MPDFKYADAETAKRYSGVEDYPGAKAALREMHRQVSDLALDGRGRLDEDCSCGTWCSPTIWPAPRR
jgi:putative pyruvate formate lyase activating enzyme